MLMKYKCLLMKYKCLFMKYKYINVDFSSRHRNKPPQSGCFSRLFIWWLLPATWRRNSSSLLLKRWRMTDAHYSSVAFWSLKGFFRWSCERESCTKVTGGEEEKGERWKRGERGEVSWPLTPRPSVPEHRGAPRHAEYLTRYTWMYNSLHTHTQTHTHSHTLTHKHTDTHKHTHSHTYTQTHTCTLTHTNTYTHTQTHTLTHWWR